VIPRKPVNVVNLASTAATAREALQLPIRELPRPEYLPEGVINPSQTQQQPSTNGDSSTVATLQYGFREFKHFAGGLLHHPAESTKHFSILRHSSGLVCFSGSTTSVAISIFSDAAHLLITQSGYSQRAGLDTLGSKPKHSYAVMRPGLMSRLEVLWMQRSLRKMTSVHGSETSEASSVKQLVR